MVGPFRVEPSRNVLKKDDEFYPLEPKIMDVLCLLAANHRDVVSRDQIVKTVWRVEYGADESLTRAISLLRKTFKKGGVTEKYIETISKGGYRMVAPLSDFVPKTNARNKTLPVSVPTQAPTLVPKPRPNPTPPTANPPSQSAAVTPSPVTTTPSPTRIGGSGHPLIFLGSAAIIFALITFLQRPDKGPAIQPIEVVTTHMDGGQAESVSRNYGRSVAVLSFSDMSPEQDQRHFAQGMAEELLIELSEIPNLRVASRRAAANASQDNLAISEMGDRLKVSHIIEGSVRKQGERVRIAAQLVNTENSAQVWSQSYDGTTEDVLTLQSRIARDIISELKIVLSIGIEDVIPIDIDGAGAAMPSEDR